MYSVNINNFTYSDFSVDLSDATSVNHSSQAANASSHYTQALSNLEVLASKHYSDPLGSDPVACRATVSFAYFESSRVTCRSQRLALVASLT